MNLKRRILAIAVTAAMTVTALGMTTFASIYRYDLNISSGNDTRYYEGDEYDLNYSFDNDGNDNLDEDNLLWDSNNDRVATVDSNGTVYAHSAGTATITVRLPGTGLSDTITITVRDYDDWNDGLGSWNNGYNERWDRGDDYYDPYLDEWVRGGSGGRGYRDEYGIDRRRDDYELARQEFLGKRASARPTATANRTPSVSRAEALRFSRDINLTEAASESAVVNAADNSSAARLDNYASVSISALQAAAKVSSGVINFDTRSGGELVGRLQITPSRAVGLPSGTLKLGVHYEDSDTKAYHDRFNDQYSNQVHVIQCEQGNFGMTVRIYALLGTDVDVNDLVFYNYSPSNNTISKLEVASVSQDENGYVSFNTTYGGTILISEDGNLRG